MLEVKAVDASFKRGFGRLPCNPNLHTPFVQFKYFSWHHHSRVFSSLYTVFAFKTIVIPARVANPGASLSNFTFWFFAVLQNDMVLTSCGKCFISHGETGQMHIPRYTRESSVFPPFSWLFHGARWAGTECRLVPKLWGVEVNCRPKEILKLNIKNLAILASKCWGNVENKYEIAPVENSVSHLL